jgi:hypothetical protein
MDRELRKHKVIHKEIENWCNVYWYFKAEVWQVDNAIHMAVHNTAKYQGWKAEYYAFAFQSAQIINCGWGEIYDAIPVPGFGGEDGGVL